MYEFNYQLYWRCTTWAQQSESLFLIVGFDKLCAGSVPSYKPDPNPNFLSLRDLHTEYGYNRSAATAAQDLLHSNREKGGELPP